jgi:hypothetical protein
MYFRRDFSFLFAAFVPVLLSGCYGLEDASDALPAARSLDQTNSGPGCGDPQKVFQTAVYPYLQTNCAGCHASQSPAFAPADASAAYAQVKALVDFNLPANSLLLARATDRHCGTGDCAKDGSELLGDLKKWATSETGGAGCTTSISNQGVNLRMESSSPLAMASVSQVSESCVGYTAVFVKDGSFAVPPKDLVVQLSGADTYSDSACENAANSVLLPATAGTNAGGSTAIFYVWTNANARVAGAIDGYALGFSLQIAVTASVPSPVPSVVPSAVPSMTPSPVPSATPTSVPSSVPSAVPSPTVKPSPTPSSTPAPSPIPAFPDSGSAIQNKTIATQTGKFVAEYDAIPLGSAIDALTMLAGKTVTAFADAAILVRFNTSGLIDAIDGASYAAASVISYASGKIYHFRIDGDVVAKKYSVAVTLPDGTVHTLASGYDFRAPFRGS